MSITISRNDLKEAIASLSKLQSKNPSMPLLSAVSISSSITGLKITATNLNEYLSCNIKGKSDYPTALIVSLPELKEYVEYSKLASTYTLTKTYKADVRISSDTEEHKEKVLKCFPEGEWPDMPDAAKPKSNLISKESLRSIQSAIPSVSTKDTAREALKCLLLEDKAVVASNGIELIKIACDTDLNDHALIPVTKFLSSAALSDRDSSIGIQKFNDRKYLSISNDKWEYTIRLSDETYPSYMNVIPKETTHSFTFLKGDMARLQSEIPFLAFTSEMKPVHLYLTKETLTILPEEIKGKSIILPVIPEGSSKPISKTISRSLLLRAFSLGFNKLSFSEGLSPVLASGSGDSFMVFMPVRTHDETIKLIEESINSTNSNTQTPNTKEESKMNNQRLSEPVKTGLNEQSVSQEKPATTNYTPTFQGSDIKADPMEELINKISTVRTKAREIIDITIDVSNQLRNMQKASRTKERDFKSANELLEKLKKVSGF